MCLNVISEVLAILAIGLVNFSCVGLSGLEIQGPENETQADLFTGGWVSEANTVEHKIHARPKYSELGSFASQRILILASLYRSRRRCQRHLSQKRRTNFSSSLIEHSFKRGRPYLQRVKQRKLNKGNGAMNPIHGGTTKGPYQVVLSVIFGK